MMLRALSLFILLVAVLTVAASATAEEKINVRWRTDIAKAAREAHTSRKPLLIQVTAEWCGFCKKMLKETYTDEGIAKHANGCFIPLTVDADEYPELMEELQIDAYPSTLVIDPSGQVVSRVKGFQDAEKFTESLNNACRSARKLAVANATEKSRN
ncbi:thioredoxin family protein [Calycomorphotria hydatis]|uniref:Thiol:disulfide interchange protein DsbD n=1 Tax=Calycomorphotria hydatis TaxID=2528027 RepID=A0A517T4D0_9PLAN|nr:DUF255 domain-containing protein [Calycomorphotria hydatis]QDT63237.1 Thiol:disulfide interchange protein DsbD precursor [Calycomorphotria hydatis]